MRHAPKDPNQLLTVEGIQAVRDMVRDEIVPYLDQSNKGQVYAVIPSVVSRAVKTREIFEEELEANLVGENYQMLDVKDLESIKAFNNAETDKKLVITNLQPQHMIGYRDSKLDSWIGQFLELEKQLGVPDTLIGKLWIATPEELPQVQAEILKINPDIDLDKLNPALFNITPEQEAIEQIQWMIRILRIAEKQLPNKPVEIIAISHNVLIDFAAIALLGRELTTENLNELGGVRNFLEKHEVFIEGNQVNVSFRGETHQYSLTDLNQLTNTLKEKSEDRKASWS